MLLGTFLTDGDTYQIIAVATNNAGLTAQSPRRSSLQDDSDALSLPPSRRTGCDPDPGARLHLRHRHDPRGRRRPGRQRPAQHFESRSQRTSIQDADNAVTIAMDYVRYNYVTPTSPARLLPAAGFSPAAGNRTAERGLEYPVVRSTHQRRQPHGRVLPPGRLANQPTQPASSTSTPAATGTPATQCTGVTGDAIVHARVAYNDLNPQGLDNCFNPPSAPVPTSCGLAMNIQVWDVIGADN